MKSLEAEYRRYKNIADAAMAQVSDSDLHTDKCGGGNSIAVVVWHIAGNLASRFTDFLESDGEKPWRNRNDEFASRTPTRQELLQCWEEGWNVLFASISGLSDEQLHQTVVIRGAELAVHAALHRSLAHVGYHVGQIVYLAKTIRGAEWQYLSIPPGESDSYNQNPTIDRPEEHSSSLNETNRK